MEENKSIDIKNFVNEEILDKSLEFSNIIKDHEIIDQIANKEWFEELKNQILESDLSVEEKTKLICELEDKYQENYKKGSGTYYENQKSSVGIKVSAFSGIVIVGGCVVASVFKPELAKDIFSSVTGLFGLGKNNNYIDVA